MPWKAYLQAVCDRWNLPGGSTYIPPRSHLTPSAVVPPSYLPITSRLPCGYRIAVQYVRTCRVLRDKLSGTLVGPGWNLWEGSTSLNPFIYRHFRPFRWNVEPFHDFCRQQSISLVARLLITRASRAYFSRPTRLLLKADENTPHDLREYFSYFTIKGKRNYGKFWRINIISKIRGLNSF